MKFFLETDKLNPVFTGRIVTHESTIDFEPIGYEAYMNDVKTYADRDKENELKRRERLSQKILSSNQAERERERKRTEAYAKKALRDECDKPAEKKVSRKLRRLMIYSREDVHIIASAALAVGKNNHAEISDDQYDVYINDVMQRAGKIIDDYDEYKP